MSSRLSKAKVQDLMRVASAEILLETFDCIHKLVRNSGQCGQGRRYKTVRLGPSR